MQNLEAEDWLKQRGFKPRYHKRMKLDQIDWAEARENPSRLHRAIDTVHRDQIALEIMGGLDVSAIVVLERPGRKYRLLDGVHRYSATQEAELDTIDVIIVTEADECRIRNAIVGLNCIKGKELTMKERLVLLVDHMREFPADDLTELCKVWYHVKEQTARDYIHMARIETRAAKFNCIDALAQIKAIKLKLALDTIHSDAVFARAVRVFVNIGFRSDSAVGQAHELREMQEKDAFDLLDQLEQEDAERKNVRGHTPSAASTAFLGLVKKITDFRSVLAIQCGGILPRNLSQAQAKVRAALELLHGTDKELARLIEYHNRQRPPSPKAA